MSNNTCILRCQKLQGPIWNLETRFRPWVALTTLAESSCFYQKGTERRSSSTVAQIIAAVSKSSLKEMAEFGSCGYSRS